MLMPVRQRIEQMSQINYLSALIKAYKSEMNIWCYIISFAIISIIKPP